MLSYMKTKKKRKTEWLPWPAYWAGKPLARDRTGVPEMIPRYKDFVCKESFKNWPWK